MSFSLKLFTTLAALASTLLGSSCSTANHEPSPKVSTVTPPTLDEEIQSEIQWLIDLQLPSGAIPLSLDKKLIQPYFANQAMTAVLKVKPENHIMVSKWIDWYLTHLNLKIGAGIPGSIFDFEVSSSGESSLNTHDSVDSYAATFLTLIGNYYQITGDRSWALSRISKLMWVYNAILRTLSPNGLTSALPGSESYLMDNVEVWRGLEDFAEFLKSIGKKTDAKRAKTQATRIRKSIEKNLWNSQRKTYLTYFGDTGENENQFYPDGVSKLWPLIFQLPETIPRSKSLWTEFKRHSKQSWSEVKADSFAWSSIAYLAVKMGDEELAKDWEYRHFVKGNREWPWHVGETAGYLLYLNERKNLRPNR